MGIKHIFKPPREMSREDARELLQDNGVRVKDDNSPHRRKFKFGEFSKFAKAQATFQEPLIPRGYEEMYHNGGEMPSSGSSDDPYNPATQPTVSGLSAGATATADVDGGASTSISGGGEISSVNDSHTPVGASAQQLNRQPPSNRSTTQHEPGYRQARGQTSIAERSGAPSYHTYDPYAEEGDPYGEQDSQYVATGQRLEQLEEGYQEEEYDPYADPYAEQAEVEEDGLDFNSYPGAENEMQAYDPYLDAEELQQQQEADEEQEEINRIVRQTKDTREATLKSTHNIIGHLRQADDTAANTMGVLGSQRERMFETEHTLNQMDTHQRFVDEHVKDLQHYSRGLFHIKASNPFTKKSRRLKAEQKFLAERAADRERDASLGTGLYRAQNDIVDQFKRSKDPALQSELKEKYEYERRVREASRFLTEDRDEEDERMEVEYSKNLDEAQKLAENLKKKANVISAEILGQNKNLKEISEKVNRVDDKLVLTTNRIRGI